MEAILSRRLHSINYTGRQKKKKFPVKIQGDYYNFDIADSEYYNQIVLPPTSVKGQGIKSQNYFCNKKGSILVSNYNIQYQITNNVSLYGILTRKKFI